MPLTPDSIANSHLPRTKVPGGYSIEATDEFLKKVAWEFRKVQSDCRKLLEQNDVLERQLQDIRQRLDELRGNLIRHEREPLARASLAAAYRAAEAVREEARQEGNTVLEKARKRAKALDEEVERARALTAKQVSALEEMQTAARNQLSAYLVTLLTEIEGHWGGERGAIVRELKARAQASDETSSVPDSESSNGSSGPSEEASRTASNSAEGV